MNKEGAASFLRLRQFNPESQSDQIDVMGFLHTLGDALEPGVAEYIYINWLSGNYDDSKGKKETNTTTSKGTL